MSEANQKPTDNQPVPKAVVNRLSLYLRELQHLVSEGSETISSGALGQRLGCSDAQVRKDLAYFGQFGYPGIGYRCAELVDAIRKILGTQFVWPVVMVGVGNLGRALLGYKGFAKQGFHIVAALDSNRSVVGTTVEDVHVDHIDELDRVMKEKRVRLAMIAVPAPAAQQVADRMVRAGVEGIVNFAPVTISIPDHVSLIGVDLAIELEQIAFAVVNRNHTR
ncbi:MAG: redox-sensing transcriptional repressor Rex [Pirellulales bacterium]